MTERTITSDDVRCPKCYAGSAEMFSQEFDIRKLHYFWGDPVQCPKCGAWFKGWEVTLHRTTEVPND